MKCVNFLIFGLILGTRSTYGMQEFAKVSPNTLSTIKDCKAFSTQTQYEVIKCDAYYQKETKMMFLDSEFKHSLLECAETMKMMPKMPSIIYTPKNLNDFSQMDLDNVERQTNDFIEAIPMITYFNGPGSDASATSVGFEGMKTTWMAVRVNEREKRGTAYTQTFFNDLTLINQLQVTQRYLFLNGWHLKNMVNLPMIESNLIVSYTGLFIYVSKSHAHLIGKNEVVKFLNGTQFPVYFDMPGSPDYLAHGVSLKGHKGVWIFTTLVIVSLKGKIQL